MTNDTIRPVIEHNALSEQSPRQDEASELNVQNETVGGNRTSNTPQSPGQQEMSMKQDDPSGDEDAYAYELKVPHERIAVVIGKNGQVKKRIEEELQVRVEIDSREGDVRITGRDPLNLYTAREIIRAISRGFNPETAFDLLKQDYVLDIIPITDYARTRNALIRLRGRVIGEHGRSRRTIENMTNTAISVYGKTVGIIGRVEDVSMARRAVEMLLGQAQHAPVYKMLEKYRAEQRRREALWLSEEDEIRQALREEFYEDPSSGSR